MADLGWTLAVVGFVASADFGWTSYRRWRVRRHAAKHGRTLTAKFALDRD
ncbi:MAG TPA: hypothetical protein VMU87_06295 [Stellaceae bacterium]|nr:hypothetical protein [Stellaceae bacterium]